MMRKVKKAKRSMRCRRRYGAGHCPHAERHSLPRHAPTVVVTPVGQHPDALVGAEPPVWLRPGR